MSDNITLQRVIFVNFQIDIIVLKYTSYIFTSINTSFILNGETIKYHPTAPEK